MSVGLIALLDDLSTIARAAAASLDDVASQAAKAGAKAAGVVIDDAAVTPSYVVGFPTNRELAIVRRIAVGSLRNKLLILTPVAVVLSAFVPGAITPLLTVGGAWLSYEGAEKLFEALMPHRAHQHEAQLGTIAMKPGTMEDERVASAIKTDFILSAEIIAITLAALPKGSLIMQTSVLVLVGIAITVAVYGLVALILKADDFGLTLANLKGASFLAAVGRVLGRALVSGMPGLLSILAGVGTAAMLWVGGGIILHGLEIYGPASITSILDVTTRTAGHGSPFLKWTSEAAISGICGLLTGAVMIPSVEFVIAPTWMRLKRFWLEPNESRG